MGSGVSLGFGVLGIHLKPESPKTLNPRTLNPEPYSPLNPFPAISTLAESVPALPGFAESASGTPGGSSQSGAN